ncbi:MAG: DUF4160 domain-containing protein [Myxococcota bacterium]
MPEISRFLGLVVRMYWDDHPPPHIHVEYAGEQAILRFDTMEVVRGRLHGRALALLIEWAVLHRAELAANWTRVERGEPLQPIAPLE